MYLLSSSAAMVAMKGLTDVTTSKRTPRNGRRTCARYIELRREDDAGERGLGVFDVIAAFNTVMKKEKEKEKEKRRWLDINNCDRRASFMIWRSGPYVSSGLHCPGVPSSHPKS